MIKTENLTINDIDFIKTYSDEGFKILQVETGVVYDEAIDLASSEYTYEETDEPVEEEM